MLTVNQVVENGETKIVQNLSPTPHYKPSFKGKNDTFIKEGIQVVKKEGFFTKFEKFFGIGEFSKSAIVKRCETYKYDAMIAKKSKIERLISSCSSRIDRLELEIKQHQARIELVNDKLRMAQDISNKASKKELAQITKDIEQIRYLEFEEPKVLMRAIDNAIEAMNLIEKKPNADHRDRLVFEFLETKLNKYLQGMASLPSRIENAKLFKSLPDLQKYKENDKLAIENCKKEIKQKEDCLNALRSKLEYITKQLPQSRSREHIL